MIHSCGQLGPEVRLSQADDADRAPVVSIGHAICMLEKNQIIPCPNPAVEKQQTELQLTS